MKLSITVCAQGKNCHKKNTPCGKDTPETRNKIVVDASRNILVAPQPPVPTPLPQTTKTTAVTKTTVATTVEVLTAPNQSLLHKNSTQTPTLRRPSVVAVPQVSEAPRMRKRGVLLFTAMIICRFRYSWLAFALK